MKYLCFVGLFIPYLISAQNPFDKRINPIITCFDITYNALDLIPQYHQRGDLDSVLVLINYWEKRCGKLEQSIRARTLLEIERGIFDKETINKSFFNNLTAFSEYLSWKNTVDSINVNPYAVYRESFEDPRIMLSFDTFTSLWARDLLAGEYDTCSDERKILELYSENPDTYYSLMLDPCPDSKLSSRYRSELLKYEQLPDFDWGFVAEYWMPKGSVSLLGNHPGLGIYGGLQYKKWLFDFTMLFRFIEADNQYTVIEGGIEYETNHFFGGYIGADIGYELARSKHSRIYILSGIAFDGFDTLEGNDETDPSKSINSLNLNLGLGYRHFLTDNFYIGLEGKQNFVNYKNRGGTDFSGNTQSIRLLFGFMQNIDKEEKLKRLKAKN